MNIKHLILALLCSSVLQVSGQDFHNSFFQFAPMNISPTLTGAFYGNVRANVIARDQGRNVALNNISRADGTQDLSNGHEWKDISLAVDYNVDFGLTEGDWVSVGMNLAKSVGAGVGDFSRQFTGIDVAYHLAFGKKADKVFTVGFKYGKYNLGFNDPNLDDYYDPIKVAGGGLSADLAAFNTTQFGGRDAARKSTGDYMLGLMLDLPMGKTADIRFGIASDHLLQPRLVTSGSSAPIDTMLIQPVTQQQEELNRRINAFVFYYTDINNRLTFNPNLLVQKSGVSTNIVAQALFNYLYNKQKEISLIAGLGVRFVDSMDIPIYLGMDMKDLRVGISYDMNISGLSSSSKTFGAVEIGITKIFNWDKKATVEPIFICPRL